MGLRLCQEFAISQDPNFAPNLRRQRIWVPELKKFVRVRVTARGLKTINKHGAYKALKKAGAI
ncbi:MAG: hypothetical protein DME71_10815 [Verrucomicrobia bacterium]|nr:MAG: hypothetical protein DME71_10815 [Verrucomicrobiota bacterium]